MTTHEIPSELRQFLRDHVETYEQLEILVLLAGAPDRHWRGDDIAAALHLDRAVVAEALAHLDRAGVLEPGGGDAAPRVAARPDHAVMLARLAEVYRRDRLGIMNLMTSNALERVRTSALRAFTSAFLLGKKNDG
jgi:hypothetical protein